MVEGTETEMIVRNVGETRTIDEGIERIAGKTERGIETIVETEEGTAGNSQMKGGIEMILKIVIGMIGVIVGVEVTVRINGIKMTEMIEVIVGVIEEVIGVTEGVIGGTVVIDGTVVIEVVIEVKEDLMIEEVS